MTIAQQIWQMKYRFEGHDVTIEDSWRRVAKALAACELDPRHWGDEFFTALDDYKFLPAGRILAGAGTGRQVTLQNCFVMGTIPDSMSGIMDALKDAALTMQQGGGVGMDFSTIRPKGAFVKGVAADASGPLSFMDVWDTMCKTIMSAGSRRGAMMATLRCDHPDIEAFITAKKDPLRLRNFNLSVLITDPFMKAVETNADWDLVFDGYTYDTIKAGALWDKLMQATYDYAEPGVIFIDRINQQNNLGYCETIAATNPCVPAGTPILTKNGWWLIEETVGREVDVWNGYEWSKVTPKVTGHNQSLVTVKLSDGRELTCTPTHRFVDRDGVRVAAGDLTVGQQLIQADWPIIAGEVDYPWAYDQGFFSGDGTVHSNGASSYLRLYGKKKLLEKEFGAPKSRGEYAVSGGFEGTNTEETKVYLRYVSGEFLSKAFVPTIHWDVDSRLRWLEGLVDSDGCAVRSNNSVSVQITSKEKGFLKQIQLMLNTLGVSAHLSAMKDCWRLGISANNVKRLQQLGFAPKRLDISNNNPRRECARFTRVVEVVAAGVANIVYCFTEDKRHLGCFNGVLTGQCGEQPLGPHSACLLGSINLPKFVFHQTIDYAKLLRVVALAIRMMDNVVDVSLYPLAEQNVQAKAKRRLGLGVTGLADALIMMGVVYGSDQAVEITGDILQFISNVAYDTSADLAIEKGAFPLFEAEPYLKAPIPQSLPSRTRDKIQKTGIRNSHLTSIAPTGTISLYAGNVSSGIEPVFAFEYERKVTQKDGTKTAELVQDYARALDPTGTGSQWVDAQTLTPAAHLRMQAAAQKWVDSAISKTINLPEDIAFEDFQQVYLDAYKMGCKGCTTYRPNEVTGSVLSIKEEPKPVVNELPTRPSAVEGSTYKLKWPASDHAMYITINDLDGRPFEIFINSKNVEHFAWTVALTRMVSAVFRRGGDVAFVHEELKAVFDPQGGAWLGGKYVPSMLAAIGGVIEQHMTGVVAKPSISVKACPKCHEFSLVVKEGCVTCSNCGDSKCG